MEILTTLFLGAIGMIAIVAAVAVLIGTFFSGLILIAALAKRVAS